MSIASLRESPVQYPGELHLLMGAMTSSKSTTLIYRLTIKADLGYAVAFINTIKDKRVTVGGDGINFSSHNSSLKHISDRIDCYSVSKLSEVDVSKYDVIGVEEGHFFPDLYETVMYWVEGLDKGKYVIVSGLDSSYMRTPIGQMMDLVQKADTYQKLRGQCSRCIQRLRRAGINTPVDCPAIFTVRLTSGTELLVVGGHESYEAVCRTCYLEIERTKHEQSTLSTSSLSTSSLSTSLSSSS